ncbi:MAG: c-type cytochrome [Miltoncostaeaceae bacterium]
MNTRLRTRGARGIAALGLGVAVLWASGCGGDAAEPDLEAGKTAFASCQACHTLADAGSTGSDATANPAAGPNLDDAFRAARQAGMDEDQFKGVVLRWIKIAQPPMPRDLVTGEEAENVAAYIASVAGTESELSPVRPAGEETPEAPTPARQLLPGQEAPAGGGEQP